MANGANLILIVKTVKSIRFYPALFNSSMTSNMRKKRNFKGFYEHKLITLVIFRASFSIR